MEVVFSTNLRCESCLRTIEPMLDSEPGINNWESDLADSRKLLTVDVSTAEQSSRVVEILEQAGYSASVLRDSTMEEDSESEPFSFWAYKPLLLVVAYVLGATVLAESIQGGFVWTRAMSYFMGFFFLGFAFFKLLDVPSFADAFATYDIIAKRSRGYALLYPWIEVVLGLLFVTRIAPLATNAATAIVMTTGLVGVLAALRKKQTIQCACLGTVFNLPMSVVTVVENSVMIAMALSMLLMRQAS